MRPSLLLLVLLSGCKKEATTPALPPVHPAPVVLQGVYHAVSCGPVTAAFNGNAEALAHFDAYAGPAPKSYGVESLAFRFADGSAKGFAPAGQLFFSDWRFDVFSPDCAHVALLVDHYGPYHVLKTEDLKGYLDGRVRPLVVSAPVQETAKVHGDLVWTSPTTFEFIAACCGTAEAFRASTDGTVTSVFPLTEAPSGLRRTATGYEVVKPK